MPLPPKEHTAGRPLWNCAACGRPWPCFSAKGDLLLHYRRFRTGLHIHLMASLEQAAGDLAGTAQAQPGELYERFLAWVELRDARS